MHTTTIVGRVGADPKPIGQSGQSFSIATEEWNSSTQERETTWSRLVAFGKTAETVEKYVTKGRLIAVTCRYQVREYKDKDGNEQKDHSFFVTHLELLPDGKGQQRQQADPTQDVTAKDGSSLW